MDFSVDWASLEVCHFRTTFIGLGYVTDECRDETSSSTNDYEAFFSSKSQFQPAIINRRRAPFPALVSYVISLDRRHLSGSVLRGRDVVER